MDTAHRTTSVLLDIFKFVLIALLIITPFRFFIAQPFIVAGASMSPTLEQGQYLIIDEISYRFDEPQRGDVIIFRYPLDPSTFFVKRVIGLPGETIDIQGGVVSVREKGASMSEALEEPYLQPEKKDPEKTKITLDDGEYFVLGDNRDQSSDSRVWGPVQKRFIVGRALIRLFPLQQADLFPGKFTFDAAK